jgi:hypothetical protein
MSTAHTIPAPAAPEAGTRSRRSLLRRIAAGLLAAAILTVLVIAVWPASEAEKARADGKQLGEAVGALYNAQSAEEVEAALADVHTAAVDSRDHAGDAIADQVAAQEDALARAANGFVGTHTGDDAFESDLYQAELDVAIDDLTGQADEFRTQAPEVQQSYWDGFQEGLPGS